MYFTRDLSPEGLKKIYEKVKGALTGKGSNYPELTVSVYEAPGTKCPRCWMHSQEADENGLCKRCAAVIAKMDIEE